MLEAGWLRRAGREYGVVERMSWWLVEGGFERRGFGVSGWRYAVFEGLYRGVRWVMIRTRREIGGADL